MTIGISVVVLFILVIVNIYNEVHYSKYMKLMSHLEKYHNEIYEQIRIKPSLGPLYAKGAFRKSIIYAKNHPPIGDQIAEQLFSDYANFSPINFEIISNLVKDIFENNVQLDYNKQDIRSGVIVGIIVGLVVGAIIGNVDLTFDTFPNYESIGIYHGAIIGLFGGIVGGFYGSVREFGWKMAPVFRSIIGASLGAFGWVMGFSTMISKLEIFF